MVYDHLILLKAEARGGLLVEDLGDRLNFEIVIARAKRPHLPTLALFRPIGHACGLRASHLTMLLDALQIAGLAPAALDGPTSAAFKHRIHFEGVESDRALAAKAGGNLLVQGLGKLLLHGGNI